MFKLLKLLAYALLGYALYEFVRGMSHAEGGMGGRQMGGGRQSRGRMSSGTEPMSRPQNMTGPGEGTSIESQETDGGIVPHKVGRGVVS